MRKLILLCLLISPPAYAGSAIINLSGTNNVLNLTQMASPNILFNAPGATSSDNTYTIKQTGGGNHQASIDIEGNFHNYDFYLSQDSMSDLSIGITQTCSMSSCSPDPFIITQTYNSSATMTTNPGLVIP